MLAAESDAVFVDIQHDDLSTFLNSELHGGEADGTCSDHKCKLAFFHLCPLNCVRPDAERLDKRELIVGQDRRGMQLARWHHELLAHASVRVNSEHSDVGTTVGFSTTAGDAFLAVDIGLDRAAITRFHIGYSFTDGDHLDA